MSKVSLPIIFLNQQVDSQKDATKQANQIQNKLTGKCVHGERSAEPCATGKRVQKEEKRIGLLNRETAQVRVFLILLIAYLRYDFITKVLF